MRQIKYNQLHETRYQLTLANGLRVNLMPRAGYQKSYALLTVNYGGIDTAVTYRSGKRVTYPEGIAHFLEHKMFEKRDHDAFDLFGKYGADANAFTSYTQTSYLFNTTTHLTECLQILLDFVFDPYFSARGVAKEQGIIGQEIQMYQDDPDWRLLAQLGQSMYPKTALAADVAGTQESIATITPAMLYACWATFYQPANMTLFVTGGFDVQRIAAFLQQLPLPSRPAPAFVRRPVALASPVKKTTLQLAVNRPRIAVGLRGITAPVSGLPGLRARLAGQIGLYLLFGEDTAFYQRHYDSGLLDDSFSATYEYERGYHFMTITGETPRPEELIQVVRQQLAQVTDILATAQSAFERAKREYTGRYLQAINSLETVADFAAAFPGDVTLFEALGELQRLTLADVCEHMKCMVSQEPCEVTLLPGDD